MSGMLPMSDGVVMVRGNKGDDMVDDISNFISKRISSIDGKIVGVGIMTEVVLKSTSVHNDPGVQ